MTRILKIGLTFCILHFAFCIRAAGTGPAYPLKYNAGQHYLVDQNNVPFFIMGDSPWYLTESLYQPDILYYLTNRAAQGFNSIILDITAVTEESAQSFPSRTGNIYGQDPFTGVIAGPYTNLAAINANYFTNVDWVLKAAASNGICCFIYPMFDGVQDGGEWGWYQDAAQNSSNAIYGYGQFIGNRYAAQPNIVWIGAGDFDEPQPPDPVWTIIANGILSKDSSHLMTAQAAPFEAAKLHYTNTWCNLNDTYPRSPGPQNTTYDFEKTNWFYSPVMPSFSREPWYENDQWGTIGTNYFDCRRYAWGSATFGACGVFYGNQNIWAFNGSASSQDWKSAMQSPAAVTNVIKLLNTRPWWNFVPDYNNAAVSAGYGTYGQEAYVTAMREASGQGIIAYVPFGTMTPTVAMNQLAGWSATAWWYNPRTGAGTAIGAYATSGTQTFTPPDTNDWVLVIDSVLARSAGVHP